MNVRFAAGAAAEFEEAAAYYETRSVGLGHRFEEVVRRMVQRLAQDPERWRILERDVRRCLVSGFPYGILYSIEEDVILILAVMHCSREPGYWKRRSKT